jgi:tetratricopeptide (TPR) repeat protein
VDLLRPGRELLQHRRYLEAAQQFRTVAQTAIAAGDERLAARAIGNVGHCQFALRQFRLALDSFLEARRRSELARDSSTAAALDINIASLYAELGQMTPATEWLEGSSKELSGPDRRLYLPALQVELAFLRGREGRMPEALELFREGIDGADRNGDLNLMAQAWTRVGDVLLLGNDLAGAERAQLEAFRIRKLNRLPLDASYCSMGRLRLKQGNLDSAASLLTRAIELKPEWYAYHMLGLVRLRQGRNGDALADLRAAFHLARVWRWQAPGADSARIGAENLLDQVYTAFIEAGNRVYEQTRDAALVRETFEASEENRANSLRFRRRPRCLHSIGRPPPGWKRPKSGLWLEVAARPRTRQRCAPSWYALRPPPRRRSRHERKTSSCACNRDWERIPHGSALRWATRYRGVGRSIGPD